MRTRSWTVPAAVATLAALALGATAVVPLPSVLAVLRGDRPPATEASSGAQQAFHESTPEEAILDALAPRDSDLRGAIDRAGLGGRVDPETLRRGLRLAARPDVSLTIPARQGDAGEVRRWRLQDQGWGLAITVSLPPAVGRSEAASLAEKLKTSVFLRTLRWLRERSTCADCMERPLAWLRTDLDERALAAEVLACFRAFRTPEERVYFLGVATQANLRSVDGGLWAGAWRKPVDPAWIEEQERALSRLAGE